MGEYILQNEPVFTISTIAKLLGVSVHTLRMYEREGLIIPFKKESNQRLYSQNDLERLRCIRKTIREDKISINGIKSIYSLIPCDKIVDCSSAKKNQCSTFDGNSSPCWSYSKSEKKLDECRQCDVYKSFSACSNFKELLNKMKRN